MRPGVRPLWLMAAGFCLLICATALSAAEKRPANSPPPKSGSSKSEASSAAEKRTVTPSPPKSGPFKSEAPWTILGDRMEVNQRDHTIIFEGHVTLQQEDLTITGKRMKVVGSPVGKGKPSPGPQTQSQGDGKSEDPSMMTKIDRIEVEGGVRIVQHEKVATAEKSIYYHGENKIVLLGSPVVTQGADQVQGRMITMYLNDGRSVVEGGESTPVQAILHPRKSKEQTP